jgi:hypothetical protein
MRHVKLLVVTLVAAGGLAAALALPAGGGQRDDNRRLAPAACQPLLGRLADGLRQAQSRLEQARERPDADRQRSSILAAALADARAATDLARLMDCLAGATPPE